jgi:mannose-6-phosphate isomerase-like protein (cupin superfamily)
MKKSDPFDLASTYVRLRPDASAETLAVDATFWQRIAAGKLGTFHHEYLVTSHRFNADWPSWEMHPHGDEIVCLLSGKATFIFERDDGNESVALSQAGTYVLVPKGVWHTAKIDDAAHMLFITAGEGTQHKEIAR